MLNDVITDPFVIIMYGIAEILPYLLLVLGVTAVAAVIIVLLVKHIKKKNKK